MHFLAVLFVFLNISLVFVSAASQVDLRLGEKDFFIGEKFVITITDVIYWITGMSMGIIIAMTYIIVREFYSFQRKIDAEAADRQGRLIGSRKYPSHMEERVLTAIYTEPDNYFIDGQPGSRLGRLIGPKKYPTSLEDRMLQPVNKDTDNSF